MGAKLKKIVLDVDGKEVALTLKQVKELNKELNTLLGIPEKEFVYPNYPYPYKPTPFWYEVTDITTTGYDNLRNMVTYGSSLPTSAYLNDC